ncbi:hypothetical protein AB9K26_08805 [Psychroserpens sp. XS_ASV72]|uniref:hypothetical protein n=1 Tax=Psychroserpens sp. XS_ASV72 TaxID=3241293 RepID=UPI00351485BD
MKENADKYLDELSRKVAGKKAIESPSMDFTNNVMSQIKVYSHSKYTTYKPLISKSMWFLILLVSMASFVYVYFNNTISESSWLENLGFTFDMNFKLSNWIPNLEMSQTTFNVIVLFAIMFCIQLPILKHQLNKRFH